MKTVIKLLGTILPAVILVVALVATASAGEKFATKATGGMGDGDMVLELTPEMKDNGKLTVRFAANTHTLDLSSFDLGAITTLHFDGKVLKPTKANRMRGHHAFGKAEFDVGKQLKSFRIVVAGIPPIKERVYEWGEK